MLVAVLVFKREVAGHAVVQCLRTVGDGVTGLDVTGHILVFDLDQFGGVLCDVDGLGDDQCHRLADEAHALVGQAGAKRHVERTAAHAFEKRSRRQAFPAGGKQIGGGKDIDDPLERLAPLPCRS